MWSITNNFNRNLLLFILLIPAGSMAACFDIVLVGLHDFLKKFLTQSKKSLSYKKKISPENEAVYNMLLVYCLELA